MFKGPHVSLRAIERGDAIELHRMMNHPALRGRRYLDDEERPLSTGDVERHVEKLQDAKNALQVKVVVDEELVGYATVDYGWDTLFPFVGLVIAPDHQRSGYGSEAAHLLIDWAFTQLPATAIHSWIADWNEAALRFSESLGFTSAGRVRRDSIHDGRFSDSIPVEMLRGEWEATRAH
ncbi:MAG: GNAT family protein [Acidimicrobiia bacterium]